MFGILVHVFFATIRQPVRCSAIKETKWAKS